MVTTGAATTGAMAVMGHAAACTSKIPGALCPYPGGSAAAGGGSLTEPPPGTSACGPSGAPGGSGPGKGGATALTGPECNQKEPGGGGPGPCGPGPGAPITGIPWSGAAGAIGAAVATAGHCWNAGGRGPQTPVMPGIGGGMQGVENPICEDCGTSTLVGGNAS
mmetsp:Transcript_45806/g.127509  ORF Transcript_45806/g.127509 Transcript_45806/m.127509 type:complete len:164 (-) Transcript_45806:1011-1502(-)